MFGLTAAQEAQIEATGIIPNALLEDYLFTRLTERPFYGMPEIEIAAEKRFQDMRSAYMAKLKRTQDETNKAAKRANGLK